MFCKQCGKENPEGAWLCNSCGGDLLHEPATPGDPDGDSRPAQSIDQPETVTPQVEASTREPLAREEVIGSLPESNFAERTKPPLSGVRGWLLIFCIGTAILSPLIALWQASESKHIVPVLWHLVFAAFVLDVGITLWRVRPNALRLLKVYFIALLVLAGLEIPAWFYHFNASREMARPGPDSSLWSAGRIMIFVAIWWSYFKKSKRVKATFGQNL